MKRMKSDLRRFISQLIRKVVGENRAASLVPLLPISDSFYFDHENYWEPNVVIACRDLLNPGAVFWDIGANMGGITRLASRLVGPKGNVIAVEASLTNFRKLNNNVVVQNLNNVFLIRAAMWEITGQTLTLFNGNGGNDSLFASDRLMTSSEQVLTLTLDTLCELYGTPDVIKLDIEGAEYQALMGASELLRLSNNSLRPLIILEASNQDTRALRLLLESGFILQDLATGLVWENLSIDHPDPVSNWIAIPGEQVSNFKYLFATFGSPQLLRPDVSGNFKIDGLSEGRYQIEISLQPTEGESIYLCVYNGARLISRYHGDAGWLARSYANRQFDFLFRGDLSITIEDPDKKTIPTSSIISVILRRKELSTKVLRSYTLAP
jgi:FkbM family methyltransferase